MSNIGQRIIPYNYCDKNTQLAHFAGDPWFFFQPFLAANEDLSEEERAVLSENKSHKSKDKSHKKPTGSDFILVLGEDIK